MGAKCGRKPTLTRRRQREARAPQRPLQRRRDSRLNGQDGRETAVKLPTAPARLASNARPLYGKASNFEQDPMAEPQRAHAAAPRLPGTRFLIVEARYYEPVASLLFEGAKAAFDAAGAAYDVVRVTGALEIPAGLAIALELASADGRPYDGAIALGCVIRGDTYHFEIVAGESARALMDMAVSRRLALGNGVLTVESLEQAEERADPKSGDKGGDAARAALTLAALKRGGAPR